MHTVVNYIWQNFDGLFAMVTYLNTDTTVLKNYPPPFPLFFKRQTLIQESFLTFSLYTVLYVAHKGHLEGQQIKFTPKKVELQFQSCVTSVEKIS